MLLAQARGLLFQDSWVLTQSRGDTTHPKKRTTTISVIEVARAQGNINKAQTVRQTMIVQISILEENLKVGRPRSSAGYAGTSPSTSGSWMVLIGSKMGDDVVEDTEADDSASLTGAAFSISFVMISCAPLTSSECCEFNG
ncbi:hypothetical protein HG530_015571 [Fusarium avenaceum]|nr:hypothetical protein HG530_015571 [Fusarium avenaceum]